MSEDAVAVTVERPALDRTTITDDVAAVEISIIEDDRTRTFDDEAILRVDQAYEDGEFVATEVLLDPHPDQVRGLDGATITFADGDTARGPVPWAKTGDGQTLLVIEAGERDAEDEGGTERFPPKHECQLCRPLEYRGDDINDREGVVTVTREDGGTKTIHCCKRCADELFGTHDWTSYDELDAQAVGTDGGDDD